MDFRAAFRAAKKDTTKLTKEQIRALKEKKAAAAATREAQEAAAVAERRAAADSRSMPPPPPRMPSVPGQRSAGVPAASYHPDSQATRLHDSTTVTGAHPQASVNQGARGSSGGEVRSNQAAATLPAGFFEAGNASSASGRVAAPPQQQQQQQQPGPPLRAASVEGSTGDGQAGGGTAAAALAAAAADLTSQGSARSQAPQSPTGAAAPGPAASMMFVAEEEEEEQQGPLPKGFFEDKAADAKARGEVPKTEDEMAAEYAEFMQAVEVEAQAAAAQAAEEQEEEQADREERSEFEQFVRMQRLERLKQHARQPRCAASQDSIVQGNADSGDGMRVAGAPDAEEAAAREILEPDAAAPTIQLPKKRKLAETIRALEQLSDSEGEEGEEDAELLDWRAKKSAF